MTTRSERLRRILADAPVSGPPAAVPPAEPPAPGAAERVRRLRERLDALGVGRARTPPPAPAEGAWHEVDDDRPLEVQVQGTVRETPEGTFLFRERALPLDAAHGGGTLEEALPHAVRLRPREGGPEGRRRLATRDALFLDTETTGLAGGTGTVAFLVGTGRVEGDAFVVRQYCMRDFPEEAALLHALLEDVGDAPLVTFNGRSFDWPLLSTRFRLHRLEATPRAHLDLLPLARRLWVDTVPSHTLGTLEEHVLGLKRENDLPGWRIPQAYFDYMRTGKPGLVALAFRHNEVDVVSMLSLMGRMGAILARPEERRHASPRDLHGTARLLLDLGEAHRAETCLEAGIARAPTEEAVPLRRHLGHLLRRAGRHDDALTHWTTLARTAAAFDPEAFEQVAKLHEHRRKDFAAALAWVEEALLHLDAGTRWEEAFRHRKARLERRVEKARTPGPP